MAKGFRQFWVMQYFNHPDTHVPLLDMNVVIAGLAHKSILKWNYVIHDKDVYTEEDEEQDPRHKAGAVKPKHLHLALKMKSQTELSVISKWFGVPENFIEVLHGANAYIDAVEYHTHENPKEQAKKKYRYDDSEIHSNHDWRKELSLYQVRRTKKNGSKMNTKDYYRTEVLSHGMTLRQIIDEDADAYRDDFRTLEALRLRYISTVADVPVERINYYVCGRGGVGKGLLCRALARALFPNFAHDDDIFFEIGAKNVSFDGYDGQPVIIWNDKRAFDLLSMLGSRENVFNVFDTHPTRQRQDVKYSNTILINCVNIVNSVEDYSTFLDGLAGEYTSKDGHHYTSEDKGQSYRRFPFIIPLHEEDFDLMMNKGVFCGTREYDQYITHKHIRGNMEKIHVSLNGYPKEIRKIEDKVVQPIVDEHQRFVTRFKPTDDVNSILSEFDTYGTQDVEKIKQESRLLDGDISRIYLLRDEIQRRKESNISYADVAIELQCLENRVFGKSTMNIFDTSYNPSVTAYDEKTMDFGTGYKRKEE